MTFVQYPLLIKALLSFFSHKIQLLQAIQIAEKTEKPPLGGLFSDVYDHLPSNLEEQEENLRETIMRYPQDYPSDIPV